MFNPLTAAVVADIVAEGLLPPGPSCVDLGNQTYGVDRRTLDGILARLRAAGTAARADEPALEAVHAEAAASTRGPLVERFYKALGFRSYEAIDINSRYGSMVMDLNQDLDRRYGFTRQYELVVNTGTSEHVFNQAAFLRNAHNLSAPGGLMLHIVPFTGYTNHGFYNYQPNIFFDLAAANQYQLLRLAVADRNGELIDLSRPSDLAAYFPFHLGLAAPNDRGNTFLVALLKRVTAASFAFPCQGKYVATLEGAPRGEYGPRQAAANGRGPALFVPERPASQDPYARRARRRLKKALLGYLRRASRAVLLRL
ncbi:MAG TPA: methyltransferase domain-containing protein [Candidatus Polarisedimenticolia bacterium]|nr:methyltransferase domain-containing protein [Candidatus Polarisedimenticolia bacterium]